MKKVKSKQLSGNLFYILVIAILAIALGIVAYTFYVLTNSNLTSQSNTQEVLTKLGQHLQFDTNQVIKVVEVEDPAGYKAENSSFYANLQTGNYIIVFEETHKILIFDAKQNKIINFGTFTIIPELVGEEQIDESEKPLNIEIRYTGAVSESLAQDIALQIEEMSSNYKVTGINRISGEVNFQGYTVVLLNKLVKPTLSNNFKNQILASTEKKTILEKLPEGQEGSEADVVLIVGEVSTY